MPVRPSVEQTRALLSLPPEKWSAVETVVQPLEDSHESVWRSVAQSMLWGARNRGKREPFAAPRTATRFDHLEVQTEDGWSLPMLRFSPPAGGTGEPIILASSGTLSPESMDAYADCSLLRALHLAGYDVFLFHNRGCGNAVQPQGIATFDFDDMVEHDVPAAINTVCSLSGAQRAIWLGHGLGGQLLVGTLGARVHRGVAAGVAIGAPVKFQPLSSTARRAAAVASSLPCHWRIPLQRVQRLLTVASRRADLAAMGRQIDGPRARGILMDCGSDMAMGLAQQMATWHTVGHLVDRDNRFDYVEGMRGSDTPVMTIAASGDASCSPAAAAPVFEATSGAHRARIELGHDWGHLDLIASTAANRIIFPKIIDWLQAFRSDCWTTG